MAKDDALTTTESGQVARMNPLDALSQRDPKGRLNLGALANLDFDTLAQVAEEHGAVHAGQLGDGFALLESARDKEYLVGEPFIILDWDEWPSKDRPGTYFCSLVIKTKNPIGKLGGGTNFRLNDGSTGIYRQMRDCRASGIATPILVDNGLRVSKDYTVTEPAYDEKGQPILDEVTGKQVQKPKIDPMTGQEIKGTTFYLDTTAG